MKRKTFPAVGALVASLVVFSPVSARTQKKPADQSAQFKAKLSKDQQILHALDRLTFGPEPGDVERVRKMGVKKWVELQLHPERIAENPVLDAKLKPLDSLRMSPMELMEHYPSQQMIQAVARGLAPLPEDPLMRIAVQRLADRVRARRNGATPDPQQTDPQVALRQVLEPDQIRTLRTGRPEQKRDLLASLPQEKVNKLIEVAPPGIRGQIVSFAPPDIRRKAMAFNAPQQIVAFDLSESKIYRAVYSNRQLQEELVDFWYNHFNVFLDKGADRMLVTAYERDAIRPHVLGKFRDMLEATATSSAMMFYLDNWQSVAPQPPPPNANRNAPRRPTRGLNENYARELMELHTLGVDGGYTQKDIIEVARCFTGWTIRDPRRGGTFYYNDRAHDKGEKVVLGLTIPAGGGKEDGEKVLDILAHHPSTARFLSRELAQRFVADNPPSPLVDAMVKTFRDTDGDLRAVMKTMLNSKEFWSAGSDRAKVKTPFEMIVSAVRAVGADVDSALPLVNQVAQLGEPLYRKLEPTGYANVNAEWMNSASLLARMNFALQLAQNRVPGVKVDVSRFPETEQDPLVIARKILCTDATPETRAALEKALKEQADKNPNQKPSTLMVAGLVIGSPDFQRR